MASEDVPSELYDLVDDAYQRGGQYENGYIQKQPLKERREWAAHSARLLRLLAEELKKRLPPEAHTDMIRRTEARNAQQRSGQ